jgi:hypothetical protein
VQAAPPASVGIALLLVVSVAALSYFGGANISTIPEHAFNYAPSMGDPGFRDETGLASVFLSIIAHLFLWMSPLLLLPLAGMLLIGFSRMRLVYSVLAVLNLPMLVVGFAGAPLAAALACGCTLGSVGLLFLPSATAWFRAQGAREEK